MGSISHFSRELNEKFGSLFKENEQCPRCLEENKNPCLVMKTKGAFLRHLGSTHKASLEFIPEEEKHFAMKEALMDYVGKKEPNSQKEDVMKLGSNAEVKSEEDSSKEVDESLNLTIPVDKPKKKETKIPRKKSKLNDTAKVEEKDQSSANIDDLNPKKRFSRMPKLKVKETEDEPVLKKPKTAHKLETKSNESNPIPQPNDVSQTTSNLPDPLSKLSSMITVEKKVSIPKKTFQCGECPSVLASKLELMKHMRSHINR